MELMLGNLIIITVSAVSVFCLAIATIRSYMDEKTASINAEKAATDREAKAA
jgi:hypothetical protein